MTHYMNLHPHPFNMIACGQKTFELRLYDEKRKTIAPGDVIIFTNTELPDAKLSVRVLNLHVFSSFIELYKALPLEQCGYLPEDLSTADPTDMQAYYSPAQQAQFGVVGIEIEII